MKNSRAIRIYILLFFSLWTFLLPAQAIESEEENVVTNNFDKRAYIGISTGFSIPFGTFSAKNATESEGNFAKRGVSIGFLDFGYRIKKSIQIGGVYLNARNDLDGEVAADFLNRSSGRFHIVEGSNYELKALMIGGGFMKSKNSIDLDMLFLFGLGNVFLPSMDITQRVNGVDSKLTISPDQKFTLGAGVKLGFRIHLNEYLDLMTHGTFVVFENSFEQQTTSIPPNTGIQTISSTVSYQTFNINFGLAYRFIDAEE